LSRIVAEECRRRFGGTCVKVYAANMVTVTEVQGCREWCPILRKPVDEVFHHKRVRIERVKIEEEPP